MTSPSSRQRRSWPQKFRDAFRGVKQGVRGQSSFFVHCFTAAAVIAAGLVLRVNAVEWCLLALCIGGVLSAEMFNTALEALARAVTDRDDPHLRDALDVGSAAVLLAALSAVAVGTVVFAPKFGALLGWW
jgi:diacylglycerol kinase